MGPRPAEVGKSISDPCRGYAPPLDSTWDIQFGPYGPLEVRRRERMAKLEGLLEGLREAVSSRAR